MADWRHPPHPLVLELAQELTKTDGEPSDAAKELGAAEQALTAARHAGRPTGEQQEAVDTAAIKVVGLIANDPAQPELYTFAGYLGGIVEDSAGTIKTTWRLLYLDAKLQTWLLVGQESILLRKDVTDETSPSGSRDHVWVKADASVSQGEGPPQKNEIQARFLRGDFVSAGDFAASVTGGTYAPVTGPMCPLTPGCCGRRTR